MKTMVYITILQIKVLDKADFRFYLVLIYTQKLHQIL